MKSFFLSCFLSVAFGFSAPAFSLGFFDQLCIGVVNQAGKTRLRLHEKRNELATSADEFASKLNTRVQDLLQLRLVQRDAEKLSNMPGGEYEGDEAAKLVLRSAVAANPNWQRTDKAFGVPWKEGKLGGSIAVIPVRRDGHKVELVRAKVFKVWMDDNEESMLQVIPLEGGARYDIPLDEVIDPAEIVVYKKHYSSSQPKHKVIASKVSNGVLNGTLFKLEDLRDHFKDYLQSLVEFGPARLLVAPQPKVSSIEAIGGGVLIRENAPKQWHDHLDFMVHPIRGGSYYLQRGLMKREDDFFYPSLVNFAVETGYRRLMRDLLLNKGGRQVIAEVHRAAQDMTAEFTLLLDRSRTPNQKALLRQLYNDQRNDLENHPSGTYRLFKQQLTYTFLVNLILSSIAFQYAWEALIDAPIDEATIEEQEEMVAQLEKEFLEQIHSLPLLSRVRYDLEREKLSDEEAAKEAFLRLHGAGAFIALLSSGSEFEGSYEDLADAVLSDSMAEIVLPATTAYKNLEMEDRYLYSSEDEGVLLGSITMDHTYHNLHGSSFPAGDYGRTIPPVFPTRDEHLEHKAKLVSLVRVNEDYYRKSVLASALTSNPDFLEHLLSVEKNQKLWKSFIVENPFVSAYFKAYWSGEIDIDRLEYLLAEAAVLEEKFERWAVVGAIRKNAYGQALTVEDFYRLRAESLNSDSETLADLFALDSYDYTGQKNAELMESTIGSAMSEAAYARSMPLFMRRIRSMSRLLRKVGGGKKGSKKSGKKVVAGTRYVHVFDSTADKPYRAVARGQGKSSRLLGAVGQLSAVGAVGEKYIRYLNADEMVEEALNVKELYFKEDGQDDFDFDARPNRRLEAQEQIDLLFEHGLLSQE